LEGCILINLKEREMALNMYFVEGKGHGTIAKTIGISDNTIKSWTLRHRKSTIFRHVLRLKC